MKLIGLLGGTSWPSTPLYYERINRLVAAHRGGFHSARILLYSIDYDAIKSRYHHGWDEIPPLLAAELKILGAMGPDCVILCNNTLHKAYDRIASPPLSVPFFHVVDLAITHAKVKQYKSLLFLATKFTMEDSFFTGRLRAEGIDVVVPDDAERDEIQAIQSALAAGKAELSHRVYFRKLIARYPHCDAVVLACTELPLAIDEADAGRPVIDTISLQCGAAVAYALNHET